MTTEINVDDYEALKKAVSLLEEPSLTIQITSFIGKSVEFLIDSLPNSAQQKINDIVKNVLYKILDMAGSTLDDDKSEPSTIWHKIGVMATGSIGGFFGLPGLFIELPVTTTIMMRAILDIARGEGFSISEEETKLECLKVLAFTGNTNKADDSAESGYYLTRIVLDQISKVVSDELSKIAAAKAAAEATKTAANNMSFISTTTVGKKLAEYIEIIAARLGINLTEKMAAQVVPVIGAVTAATLNALFTDFYQNMAKGHFTILKLENKYSKELIKEEYDKIKKKFSTLSS